VLSRRPALKEWTIMSVDVVMVTFNSAATVGRALSSCRSCNDIASVVVVDNASSDGSAEAAAAAGADVVESNACNEGFARAVNRGLAAGAGGLVLLLNPDAEITPEALAALVAALEQAPDAAIAGPVLVAPSAASADTTVGRVEPGEGAEGRGEIVPRRVEPGAGSEQVELGARRFSTVVNRALWWLPLPPSLRPAWATPEYGHVRTMLAAERPQPVDYLWGAAPLLRRSFLEEIGGLDERFFMYSEDEDLGRAARARGYRVLLVPRACVAHVGGASSADRAWARARIQAANRLLLEKWEGGAAAAAFWAAVGPALFIRSAVFRVAGRRAEAVEAARQRRFLRAARAEMDAVARRRLQAAG
jgi:N-acetylglucosaminyl-diphospho-decaprenol L-rhamnosyltransferase